MSPLPSSPATTTICHINGDEDLYGIGVRTGIYAQWVATLLSRTLRVPEEITASDDANLCFQLALTAVLLFVLTGRKEPFMPVEALIALPLCFGGFAAASAPFSLPTTAAAAAAAPCRQATSLVRFLCSLHLFGILAGVSCWFWWYGIEHGHNVAGDQCPYYTFLFAKVKVSDSLIGFYRFLAVVGCVVFAGIEAVLLVMMVHVVSRCSRHELATYLLNAQMPIMPKPSSTTTGATACLQAPWASRIMALLCLVIMAVMVMVVEFTISWNGVNGINDLKAAGQALPLAVGIAGVVRVLYRGLKSRVGVGSGHGGGLVDELDLALA
ncbi:hypothetical protein ASPCAL04198 [Aspergillus calidoustus]|uniref:Uncharacterized protein n=1 Tax=Aspergillus calidoustus TaxID=454130 RepID=A0A0U5FU43_ASPCI|nr:hypothetical protein ASPCAL04198 [Aspergillus calidoustus]